MDPVPARRSREPWIFLAACLVCGLAFQGSRGLFETDEGRYAECAREMLVTGDWLVPRLQGVLHLTKPPGTYWLVAAGIEVLGRNAWGARFLLGLAFGASAFCVRTIGRALLGDAAGARAGWCYLAMLYPFAAGSLLTTDTFLAAGVLGALAFAASGLGARRVLPWCAGSAACLAAAAFVKGHLALLPWAAFVAGFAVVPARPKGRWWAGVAAATVVGILAGFAWFLWARANVPGAAEHFEREIRMRLEGTGDHAARPWWFYFEVLALGSLPWWAPIVRGIRTLTRRAPRGGDEGAQSRPDPRPWPEDAAGALRGPDGARAAGRVLLAWALVTFLVFEIVPAKMPAYVLPVAAPLAVWAGAGAADRRSPWPCRPWLLGSWLALLCGARLASSISAIHVDSRDMSRLAAAVERADPTGKAPVAVYAGSDVQGLDFYLDGRPQRVRSRDVWTERGTLDVHEEAARHAALGETWLLVVEDEKETDARVADVAGDAARLAEETPGFRVYRIVPPPR